ncbi:MAG: pantetheine-phosphate adenylyltransferase [Bacteroidales bacterium]|nr:pantetheine-phosphate adenylyltransferase [Bacteroidales bacterium]
MSKIAVFPGSFDPITKGHESIVKRAAPLFDEIIIAIGKNTNKREFFSLEKRIKWIEKVFKDFPHIRVEQYTGLTVDFCKQVGATYILRGLRTSADFEYERSIGQTNKKIYPKIETIFLLTTPEHTAINSTVVREVLSYGGDVSQFIPDGINLKD